MIRFLVGFPVVFMCPFCPAIYDAIEAPTLRPQSHHLKGMQVPAGVRKCDSREGEADVEKPEPESVGGKGIRPRPLVGKSLGWSWCTGVFVLVLLALYINALRVAPKAPK